MEQHIDVDQKILRMIDKFRSEFNKISPDEKIKTICNHSFKKPCQVHIINSPSDNNHLLIITHLKLIDDKKIYHYSLKSKSFPEELEKIAYNTKWVIHNDANFKNDIEYVFLIFGQRISNIHDIIQSEISLILFDPHNKFSALMIMGNILEINYDRYIAEQIKQHKNYQKLNKTQNVKLSKTEDTNTGFATVFDPPISIDEFKPTLSQKIRSDEFNILNKNYIKKRIQKNIIIITKGGKIWIDNDDKKIVEKIFNTIMAIALLFGISTQTIRPSDLAEIKFNIKTRNIVQYRWSNLSKIDKYLNSDYRIAISRVHRQEISSELIYNIIQITESILKNYEYTEYLRLILSAHTQLNNEDNSQSFITSWTIIEKDLYKKWSEKIYSSKINKKVGKKLENLFIDKILDILYIDKIIFYDYYSQLKLLQQLRNEVIHKGKIISNNEAKLCYNSALNIINDVVKDVVNLSSIRA